MVSIALTGAVPDAHGILHLTSGCLTLDDLERCITALQDELDVLRAEARRTFTTGTGHAGSAEPGLAPASIACARGRAATSRHAASMMARTVTRFCSIMLR